MLFEWNKTNFLVKKHKSQNLKSRKEMFQFSLFLSRFDLCHLEDTIDWGMLCFSCLKFGLLLILKRSVFYSYSIYYNIRKPTSVLCGGAPRQTLVSGKKLATHFPYTDHTTLMHWQIYYEFFCEFETMYAHLTLDNCKVESLASGNSRERPCKI